MHRIRTTGCWRGRAGSGSTLKSYTTSRCRRRACSSRDSAGPACVRISRTAIWPRSTIRVDRIPPIAVTISRAVASTPSGNARSCIRICSPSTLQRAKSACSNGRASDTPLQSLDLLNDPIYVEAARVFAENALKEGGLTVPKQLSWAFARVTGRTPDASELRTLTTLYEKSLARFKANPKGASEFIHIGERPLMTMSSSTLSPVTLAAMTTVTRAMLNLHEMITRD